MSKNSESRRLRMTMRANMFLQNPFCFWCGDRMLMYPTPHTVESFATIEHHAGVYPELVHKRCNR